MLSVDSSYMMLIASYLQDFKCLIMILMKAIYSNFGQNVCCEAFVP